MKRYGNSGNPGDVSKCFWVRDPSRNISSPRPRTAFSWSRRESFDFWVPGPNATFSRARWTKSGVEGEFFAKGEYKSAPEMFTRKDSSPINRDAELSELRHVEDEILPLLSRARGITAERWHQALSTAIYSADDAKAASLIDGVEHADQEIGTDSPRLLRRSIHCKREVRRLSLPSRISVVVARAISYKSELGSFPLGGEPQITPNRMDSHLRKAASDCRTKAIVLRVSSPGGEVLGQR